MIQLNMSKNGTYGMVNYEIEVKTFFIRLKAHLIRVIRKKKPKFEGKKTVNFTFYN